MYDTINVSLFFLIIIVFFLLISVSGGVSGVNNIEGMSSSETDVSRSSDCQQSLKDYLVAVDAQKKEDEDKFNKAVNDWKTKKNAFQNAFSGDPTLWKRYCADGSCDMNNFFTRYPQTGLHELDLPNEYSRTDVSGCLQKCLNRDDCHFVSTRSGECWLKGGTNDTDNYTYIKTNTGWKKMDNLVFHGADVGNYPETYNPQQNNSKAQREFNAASVNKRGAGTWYKDIRLSGWNGDTYFKNVSSTYTFPDTSPAVITNIGAYPIKEKTQIPLELVCMDCRSVVEKTQVNDSKEVQISQFNQCIANLNDAKNPSSNNTQNNDNSQPVKEDETSSTPSSSASDKPGETSPTSPSLASNKRVIVIGGISLSLFILTSMIVVIAIIMTRS